ncbi:MAG: hypothetical protein LH609_13615, partial [Rudanella sp.]|nr:hypothetical protein [Rudanella sp.]
MAVGAEVVPEEQKNQQLTSHAHRETNDIQKRVRSLGAQIPPGDFEIVSEHDSVVLGIFEKILYAMEETIELTEAEILRG